MKSKWTKVEKASIPTDYGFDKTLLCYHGNAFPPYVTVGRGSESGGTPFEYVVTHWMLIDVPMEDAECFHPQK